MCDGRCKFTTLSLLQSIPVCAVFMVRNHCAALAIPPSPLHTIQVTCYSCMCSFVTAKSLPPAQPSATPPYPTPATVLYCTLHSYPHTLTTMCTGVYNTACTVCTKCIITYSVHILHTVCIVCVYYVVWAHILQCVHMY